MKTILIFLLGIMLMTGCITEKRCARRFPPEIKTEVFVQHDTITELKDSLIPLPADSGLIRALLECREGKVVVREILDVKPGRRVVPTFSVANNVLTAGAKIDSSAIYFAWKQLHTRETKTKILTIEKVVYRVSGFQRFLIWTGSITLLLIALLIGYSLLRIYLKKRLLP